ncbi:MAG: fasciclin domain-containing protein [Nonlabens sp.]|uniref:fasciclin domain-containing protein n=1 Tax=Nonlabens sp. TaxID=1888209 RepID=UPI003EF76AD0
MKTVKLVVISAVTASIILASCKKDVDKTNADSTSTEVEMEQDMRDVKEDAQMIERESTELVDELQKDTNKVINPSDRTIVQNVNMNKDFSTLAAAIKAAELEEILNGDGPFTVFAPNDTAFNKLHDDSITSLLKMENKEKLAGILTYHTVSGDAMASDLMKMIKDGKGKATISTVQGKELTATLKDGKIILKDANGGTATVTTADLKQSNGVVHVIDNVLMPK